MQFVSIWRNKNVFLFALLAGLIFILPDLLMPVYRDFYQRHYPAIVSSWGNNGSFTPIDVYGHPDTGFYGARSSEAARRWLPGDPFIDENKSRRLTTLDAIAFTFVGSLARLTGSINSGWTLARFFGGIFWVLALYAFLFKLTGRARWSLMAVLIIAIFWDFFMIFPCDITPKRLLSALYWQVGHFQYNLGATRMLNPALAYPPFFFAIYLTFLTGESRRLGAAWGAGLVGGALAYVHTDVWTTYMAASAIYIILNGYANRSVNRYLLASWALAFLVSFPWIAYNLPLSPDVLSRSEVTYGYVLDWGGVWLAAGAFACTWLGLRKRPDFLILAGVLWATAAAVEVQLIKGYTIQSFHWFRIGNTFMLITLAAWIGRRIQDRRDYLWVSILVVVFACCRAATYAGQRFPYQALRQDDETAMTFLNTASKAGSRVAVLNPLNTLLIPIYTHNKTVVPSGYPLVCDLPTQDILQRIRFVEHLYGIPEDRLIASLQDSLHAQRDKLGDLLWEGKTDWALNGWVHFFYIYTHLTPTDKILAQLKGLKNTPLLPGLNPDYLWVGPFERGLMMASNLHWGKPVYQNATVTIYAAAH